MRIWFFDKHSGELIPSMEQDKGQDTQESPREPGVFIESIYSTKVEPPETNNNQTAVFNGIAWDVVKDFRELKAWKKKNGEQIVITEIDEEPEDDYIEIAPEGLRNPVYDETLESWREKTEKELYAERYATDRDATVETMRHDCQLALENKYFYKEIDFKGKHVRSDIDSQKIITGYLAEISIGSRAYPLYWITCENDMITIDNQTEMISMVSQMSAWVEQSIFACRTVKDAIDDAETFEDAWAAFIAFRDAEI